MTRHGPPRSGTKKPTSKQQHIAVWCRAFYLALPPLFEGPPPALRPGLRQGATARARLRTGPSSRSLGSGTHEQTVWSGVRWWRVGIRVAA